ncbi:MAG: lytic transglycosylase domain-containing protein [Pseudomonadota bacterium]
MTTHAPGITANKTGKRYAALTALLMTLSLWSASAHACWEEAAKRYGIDVRLLYAIAKTESSVNPQAVNRNGNGTYDVGLMQINSSWFPTLRRFGIQENHLYDPCVSLQVGAWILAQNARRMGNSWEAIGAYNSGDPDRRLAYARRVYKNLPTLP